MIKVFMKISKIKILNRSTSSEHEVFFSSLSCNSNININEILEIGTYDGANAFLLSLLFKNSNIETIDLESNKDDFINFYNRKNNAIMYVNLFIFQCYTIIIKLINLML